jgi:hypothetical protein
VDIEERVKVVWPDAPIDEIHHTGPLGSRSTDNVLLYWRTRDRVTTGMIGTTKPCFEGSMMEFEMKVKTDYSNKVNRQHVSEETRQLDLRRWAEYNLAIRYLKDLPPL